MLSDHSTIKIELSESLFVYSSEDCIRIDNERFQVLERP